MRNLLIVCVSAMLSAAIAQAAAAAEPVSKSTLSAMGLGKMQELSAQQGETVRGRFTRAYVYGPTYNITRQNFAAGGNFSFSGGSFSFGGSIAVAH